MEEGVWVTFTWSQRSSGPQEVVLGFILEWRELEDVELWKSKREAGKAQGCTRGNIVEREAGCFSIPSAEYLEDFSSQPTRRHPASSDVLHKCCRKSGKTKVKASEQERVLEEMCFILNYALNKRVFGNTVQWRWWIPGIVERVIALAR